MIGELRDEDQPQILLGAQRRATGAGFLALFDRDGQPVMRSTVTDAGIEGPTMRSLDANQLQQVALGYQEVSGEWVQEVFDLTGDSPVSTGRATVAPEGAQVVGWVVGDFDGDSSNDQEIATLVIDPTRSVSWSLWRRFGGQLNGTEVFDSSHVDPSAIALRPVEDDRDDLLILAGRIGAKPRIVLLRFDGEELIRRLVLGPDVR